MKSQYNRTTLNEILKKNQQQQQQHLLEIAESGMSFPFNPIEWASIRVSAPPPPLNG